MNRSYNLAKILLVMTSLCIVFNLNAAPSGLYRWTDENGRTQYSDRPPENIESKFIKLSSGKSSKSNNSDKSSSADSGQKEGLEPGKALEVMPAKDPALCLQAQKNLKALEGARIRITEPDGSKRFLTEDEKEGQRENARKFIKINC
ncbi:MAG: hypothetical protein ACI92E_000784 [Oceanicoccus sp.]|jgi:hypothetical protein